MASRTSNLERRQQRAELRDAAPAFVALIVTNAIVAVADLEPDRHGWHVAVALLPLPAALWLAWVHVRVLRRCDEYQRIVHLQALAIGFLVSMLIALTGGLLSAVEVGSDATYLQLTFIIGIVAWVGSLAALSRR
jgi:hypothetical protein